MAVGVGWGMLAFMWSCTRTWCYADDSKPVRKKNRGSYSDRTGHHFTWENTWHSIDSKFFFQPACQKFTFRGSETHETASNSRPLQHEISVNLLCLQMKMHKNTGFWYDWMKTSLKRQSTPRACYRRRHHVFLPLNMGVSRYFFQ